MGKARIEHLYVHVPFCTHICPYCAFVKTKNSLPEMKLFLPALMTELNAARQEFDLDPQTIFFGGGTPTALSLSQLESFFAEWPWIGNGAEFTMESNPATISAEKAALLLAAGVNRISLGVQSFDSELLKLLGRTHDREQVLRTVDVLRSAGLENLNLDLMFALPGQSLEQWQSCLLQAVELQPEHISCYNLNYEEDTAFFERLNSGLYRIDERAERGFFLESDRLLGEAGYIHEEISNYAQPGFSCVHNWSYWQGKDYLGLGPGAFSTVQGRRWQNEATVDAYARRVEWEGSARINLETLSPQTLLGERIMLGLRTWEGVLLSDLIPWENELKDLQEAGLIRFDRERAKLTAEGSLVADSIAEIFI